MPRRQDPELTSELKRCAERLGFELGGVCAAATPAGFAGFSRWLEAGYAGEMDYMAARREAYEHPSHVLSGARSILMLGLSYHTLDRSSAGPGQGQVSRYAWAATDYHDLVHQRLQQLRQWVTEWDPDVRTRGVVDTAPLLERDFARQSGLGWIGKNTLLLNRQWGSWFFLAALILDCPLEYDAAHTAEHCGTCTACLDACPTDAFPEPFVLDATRCISYLTIELRSPIPCDLRPAIGDRVFGCDICQDVCPWNGKAQRTQQSEFLPLGSMNPMDLGPLFELDDQAFRSQFRRTPLWRIRRRGLLRNAAIALGNRPHASNLPALDRGLHDSEPLVRGASAWALGQHPTQAALDALARRRAIELDQDVLAEIDAAVGRRF